MSSAEQLNRSLNNIGHILRERKTFIKNKDTNIADAVTDRTSWDSGEKGGGNDNN